MTVATPPAPPAGNQQTPPPTPDQLVLKAIESEVRKYCESLGKNVESTQRQIDEVTKEFEAFRQRGNTNNGDVHEEDAKKFSYCRFFLGLASGKPAEEWGNVRNDLGQTCGFEGEVVIHSRKFQEKYIRTQVVQTDTAGGFLVAPQVGQQLIDRLIAKAVLTRAGAQMPTATGIPFTLPSVTGGTTFYWSNELGQPTKSTVTFGQRTWTPKRGTSFVKLSKLVLRNATQSIEGIVRNIMAQDMALGVDIAGLEGGGTGGEPLGLHPRTTVDVTGVTATGPGHLTTTQLYNSTGANSDRATAGYISMMTVLLEENNWSGNRMVAITHPSVAKWLITQTAVQVSGQTSNDLTGGGQNILAPYMRLQDLTARNTGLEWLMTTAVSKVRTKGNSGAVCGTVYIGDWSNLLMPIWGGMEFQASDVTGDSTGNAMLQQQLWITANTWLDSNVLQPSNFVFCPSFKTV